MWEQVRGIAADAVRDFLRSWKSLALTDLGYKVVAFALLTPLTVLLFRWLVFSDHNKVVADADILRFFVTTRVGLVALVLVGAILLAISALELACLMAIGLAAAKGTRMSPKHAVVFGATHAPNVLRLTVNVVVRLLAGLLPFLVLLGLVYWLLLSRHDINYYLAERPPEFWAAAGIATVIGAALAVVLVWTVARWIFALPLVLFEEVSPRRALGESASRSVGDRPVIVVVVAAWGSSSPGAGERGHIASRGHRPSSRRHTSPARWRCSSCSSQCWLSSLARSAWR